MKKKEEIDLYPFENSFFYGKNGILVLSPHPDDETIGCGGTIIKYTNMGIRVKIVFITDGQKGDFQKRYGQHYICLRRSAAQKAMEILGVKEYEFWGYEDRLLYQKEKKLSKKILEEVKKFNPDLIFFPSPFEIHPDHRAIFNAVWKIRKKLKKKLVLYEIIIGLYPNILVDITNEIEKKKKAMKCYYTELYYNNYFDKIIGLNRFRTLTLAETVRYAEGFILIDSDNIPFVKKRLRLIKAIL